MKRISRTLLPALLGFCCLVGTAAAGPDGEVLSVRTVDGREFAARIDGRTDANRLWLRFEEPGSVVLRSWPWSQIAGGSRAGQPLDRESLTQLALELKTTASANIFPSSGLSAAAPPPRLTDESLPYSPPPFAHGVLLESGLAAAPGAVPLVPPGTIRQIRIDAEVCNWDADVEVDGLLLSLWAVDAWGRSWPVSGSLHATLTARQAYGNQFGRAFPEIAQWHRTVRSEDYGSDGAWLKLEFQGVHPEWAHSLASSGLLHVRFTAPGHGTFAASAATLRIRPFSAFRDRLQQRTQGRFLAGEKTAR